MLGHLPSLLVLHQSQNKDVFIRRFVKHKSGDGKKGVEPSSCLIHRFGNKVGRELRLEKLFVLKRIVMLRKGH